MPEPRAGLETREMLHDRQSGRVVQASAAGAEIDLDEPPGGRVYVAFDRFASEQPPAVGERVPVYLSGWRFGARPAALWSLERPPAVELPAGVRLCGFRSGRKRHLKFLVHQVGLDRERFDRTASRGGGIHPASGSAARLRRAAIESECPAAVHGQAACNGEPSVRGCGAAAFWSFEAPLAALSRRYQEQSLAVAAAPDTLACLIIGRLSQEDRHAWNEESVQGDETRQSVRILLVANPGEGFFVKAATLIDDQDRYSLLTAYIPKRSRPVDKLVRQVERAEHISRIHAPASLRNLANLLEVKAAILATRRTGILRAVPSGKRDDHD